MSQLEEPTELDELKLSSDEIESEVVVKDRASDKEK